MSGSCVGWGCVRRSSITVFGFIDDDGIGVEENVSWVLVVSAGFVGLDFSSVTVFVSNVFDYSFDSVKILYK